MPAQSFRHALVPEDRNGHAQRAEARALWRATAACALSRIHGERPVEFARKTFDDERVARIVKASVSPHSTTDSASALSISRTNPLLLVASTSGCP
jgi:hypothetical protein